MRTTIDLDPDVLQAARELAQHRRISLGRMISELSRAALGSDTGTTAKAQVLVRNGVPLLPRRDGEVVTSELVRHLEDAD